MKDEKKSVIKEALTEYDEIMEAANANAKKKLAEEFPEKFNNLLKEEINKNKSDKESNKKLDKNKESKNLDDTESNKESVMKKEETKETKKVVDETAGEGKPFVEKAKKIEKVDETAGEGKPFVEKAKKVEMVDETAGEGKPFVEKPKEVEKVEEDVKITDTIGKGEPFSEKAKKVKKPETIEEVTKNKKELQTEEFDITELDMQSVGSALENAGGDDEILTMEEIEKEISKMEGLEEELKGIEPNSPSYMEKGNKGIAFNELVNVRNKLDEVIKNLNVDEMHQGNFPLDKMHKGEYDSKLIDEKPVDEMHQGNFPLDKMHKGEYDSKLIDEEQPITDDDINAVIGNSEKEVDEAHGLANSSRRQMAGRHLPGQDYLSQGEKSQSPEYVKESKKKINGLINENKNLTKKLNEIVKYKKTVGSLLENYKTALEKYRNQLKEMAVFNTNLAHVNNLLVNEELALTQEDKIKIINEFKKIDSITDSQKKYKTFLTEMKESKKTISESIEAKITTSIQPSSKQKLDEVIEKTVYADNQHINKMKRLIDYVEKRGKKINL